MAGIIRFKVEGPGPPACKQGLGSRVTVNASSLRFKFWIKIQTHNSRHKTLKS